MKRQELLRMVIDSVPDMVEFFSFCAVICGWIWICWKFLAPVIVWWALMAGMR